ncbi:hypothetical protein HNQ95_005863 [Aminobacter ciceronei]|uniref:Uncharacterized protein n=2 Tax=Aminobacter TaxID=31988 RepID=A0ABR6HFV0_AMIAI|nr:hypothetical protein [Aminobacter ciceronei]MBA9023826.1 hypothetical protein [Aminobacter ciceronei]MBB3709426.1 hypothetical protein [Aminobacter aminovorans]
MDFCPTATPNRIAIGEFHACINLSVEYCLVHA